jgi:hypothetical protein
MVKICLTKFTIVNILVITSLHTHSKQNYNTISVKILIFCLLLSKVNLTNYLNRSIADDVISVILEL